MPMLNVRCQKCKRWIPTGFDMTYEAYKAATHSTRSVECPNCENLQTWTLDDVDRSVFRTARK